MSRLPPSLKASYEAGHAIATEIQSWANPRLRLLCVRESWLFDDRIKSDESWLSKVERGHLPDAPLPDFYGVSVIVPTLDQVPAAATAIQASFAGAIKQRPERDPHRFVYDDEHFIANLSTTVSPAILSSEIADYPFEIQIHTGIQYAWWRATHEQEYKRPPSALDWAISRAAGQARASLELLDGFLSDLESATKLQSVRPADERQTKEIELLQKWPIRRRPADIKRFSQTLEALLEATGFCYEEMEASLQQNPEVTQEASVTPIQAIYISLVRTDPARIKAQLAGKSFALVITEEMLLVEPACDVALTLGGR